jgi:dTDP-4-dehydrorhamnose 3,5-epimerase
MKVLTTEIPGVLIVEPSLFRDARGFFMETYHRQRYRQAGITPEFVQDNLSQSSYRTIRGLHYQLQHPQGKLCWVPRGEVFDVAVDLRKDSPTFGRWTALRLSAENRRQVYIPPGFAHGFCVLSDIAEFAYKCTDVYHPESEHTILWNDQQLAIDWPVSDPLLSENDRRGAPFDKASY